MKKFLKKCSLNGLGIGLVVALAIIMFIHRYNMFPDHSLFNRIMEGIVSCAIVPFGAGLFFLAYALCYYGASCLAINIFKDDGEATDKPKREFPDIDAPLNIIFFIASYLCIFFGW